MAAITSCSSPIAAGADTSYGSAARAHRKPTLVSRFHRVHLAAEAKGVRSQNSRRNPRMITATVVVDAGVKRYSLTNVGRL